MTHGARARTFVWILSGPALPLFAIDPVVRRYLQGARPFAIGRAGAAVPLPVEWDAARVRSFTSYASLESAFASGAISQDVGAILYDNERWRFTPETEQREHAAYTARAAARVHGSGLRFIAAPAVDLTRLLPSATSRPYEDFLDAGFAADAARHADVYCVQAQGSELDTQRYAHFVERAARAARDANPAVIVLAGISTNPGGQRVDAQTIVRAIDATAHVVDGYWLNVPAPSPYAPRVRAFRPDIALEVFATLEARRRAVH